MDHMKQAIDLAREALGTTSPNPAVGAVLVKDGRVVGKGYTQPPDQAHAEVVALKRSGDHARGAVLYVTLEPCCHQGRTPPCISAIIAAGVGEVHMALEDPNPLVNGKGRQALEEAGIRVVVGEQETAARKVTETYLKYIRTGLPFVIAKFSASLDGKVATRTGDARWITGEAARRWAHDELRATSDAVIAGVGTVVADDPKLTARDSHGQPRDRQPLRIVVDSSGRTPVTSRLFQEHGKVLIAGSHILQRHTRALERAGAEVLELPAGDGSVNLHALLVELGQRGIATVLVEGGGKLLGSLFDQGLVDKLVAFLAPIIIGGAKAVPAVAGTGSSTIAEALRLQEIETEQIGEDLMVIGYPVNQGRTRPS